MHILPTLLASLALLIPIGSADQGPGDESPALGTGADGYGEPVVPVPMGLQPFAAGSHETRWDEPARQVRIHQRVVVRISPRRLRARVPAEEERQVRYRRVDMGDCIDVGDIGAVRPLGDNQLLFYERGGGMVSADLARRCSARSFYSGFYVERSEDGRMCVGRDRLRSRSGAACQLASLHRLEQITD